MPDQQPIHDLLVEYYAAMESGEPAEFSAYYADNMTLTFGNSPTVTGRAAIVSAFAQVLDQVRSLHHDLINLWPQPGGLVVYESAATWNLFDTTAIVINACTVLQIIDGKFTDQRIYVDNAPLLAALGGDQSPTTPDSRAGGKREQI